MSDSLHKALQELPVAAVAGEVREALRQGHAVLTAPPGSGKTTLMPLLLRQDVAEADGIILVTPRQLAARAAAGRMCHLIGGSLGDEVGYHVRWDRRTGPKTRIRAMTEGMLLRQLEADPELPGTGIVILDEFHERSMDGDLLLALLLEICASLRDDLRLLVMSATLDTGPITALLGNARLVYAEGRQFPVTVHHQAVPPAPADRNAFAVAVATATRQAMQNSVGDTLVFLPGLREQRAVARALEQGVDAAVHILHGSMSPAEQDAALAPAAAQRKIILSTPIAQTSLTVEGVDLVVDSGWERVAVYDASAGVNRLETRRISRASAEQRAGRAGRVRAGHCLRLWSADTHAQMAQHDTPEILRADIASLLLRAAAWGKQAPDQLALIDLPSARAVERAHDLLLALGAVDTQGHITAHGRDMLRVPLQVRTANLLLRAQASGQACEGLWLAAAMEDSGASGLDVAARIADMRRRPRSDQVWKLLDDLARSIAVSPSTLRQPVDESVLARLLCSAYPDRIAGRRSGRDGMFHCADGGEVRVPPASAFAQLPWIVIAHWEAGNPRRAQLLAALDEGELRRGECAPLRTVEQIEWDAREGAVVAQRCQQIGKLIVARQPMRDADPERVSMLLCEGIASIGLGSLPWTEAARALQARVGSLRAWCGTEWPDLSDVALQRDLAQWLPVWLAGMSRLSHLQQLDMSAMLRSMLTGAQQQALATLAPADLTVPTGHRIVLQYSGTEEAPVMAVKLQAMFGQRENPCVCDGRVAVRVHLLSPAGRPLQVTQDLASFWRNAYGEVARELRGRYPKHPWPADPLSAEATMRTKTRRPS